MTERIKEFHVSVGELILCSQCIERDVKVIYASMLDGDFFTNYRLVERSALGEVLIKLRELDNSDGSPYFTGTEYGILDKIRRVRNHWTHEGYARFVYKTGEDQQKAFEEEWARLQREVAELKRLRAQTEKLRFAILAKYNRF